MEPKKVPTFFDCVSKTQYDFDGGQYACTAIALAGIRACLLKQHKTHNQFEINEVNFVTAIESGSSCWKFWWQHHGKKQKKSFIFVNELYRLPEAKNIRKRLELVEEYYGKLRGGTFDQFPHFDTLEGSLKVLYLLGNDHYGVVTIRYKSFMLVVRNDKIWLFDSHGSQAHQNCSTLARFDNDEAVSQYIRALFPQRLSLLSPNTATAKNMLQELESDDNSFFIAVFKTRDEYLQDFKKLPETKINSEST